MFQPMIRLPTLRRLASAAFFKSLEKSSRHPFDGNATIGFSEEPACLQDYSASMDRNLCPPREGFATLLSENRVRVVGNEFQHVRQDRPRPFGPHGAIHSNELQCVRLRSSRKSREPGRQRGVCRYFDPLRIAGRGNANDGLVSVSIDEVALNLQVRPPGAAGSTNL